MTLAVAAPLLALDFWRALRDELADDELVMIQESEDLARLEGDATGGCVAADAARRPAA